MNDPYSVSDFEALGSEALVQLARHLKKTLSDPEGVPVHPAGNPEDRKRSWGARQALAPTKGAPDPLAEFSGILKKYIAENNAMHHPRYLGHQVGGPLPAGAAAAFVAALMNNSLAVYDLSPAATAVEAACLDWMGGLIGWPPAGGLQGAFSSGGSLGNLTALLAARNIIFPGSFEKGVDSAARPVLFAAESAHYSVERTAGILGLGREALHKVPVDARYRMDVQALKEAVKDARKNGMSPFAVSASACSTPTGSVDPLEEIAALCRSENLWFHVDAAHGGSLLFSEKRRYLLRGIVEADSVAWDAHKMLLMPSLATAVLFRNPKHAAEAFRQEASYLLWKNETPDILTRTLECTKGSLAFPLYVCWKLYGSEGFASIVEKQCELARTFYDMIQKAAGFESAMEPEANIVCFRFRPEGRSEDAGLMDRVREELIAGGRFYITRTVLPGVPGRKAGIWLRSALMNPSIREEDLESLLAAVRDTALRLS